MTLSTLLVACLGDGDVGGRLPPDRGPGDAASEDADAAGEPEDLGRDGGADRGADTGDEDLMGGDIDDDRRDVGEDVVPDLEGPTDAPVIYDTSDERTIRGAMTLPHGANVLGQGTSRIGDISVEDGVGSLRRGGEISALVYTVQDWAEFSLTIHHVLAPTNDELNVLYFYCGNAHATSFDHIWHESYGASMDWENAEGSCSAQMEAVRSEVTLSRLNRLPQPSQLVTGFVVDGEAVQIGDQGGALSLDGRTYDVYPFEAVDCTTDCTADPADGWWELHSILRDTLGEATCFGIFYLEKPIDDAVYLSHGFCLDRLAPLDGGSLDATWTAPPAEKTGATRLPTGPRHPVHGHVLRPGPE